MVSKSARCRVGINLEFGHEPTPRVTVKVALGIGNERAEGTVRSYNLRREPIELTQRCWPTQQRARRTVNSQGIVYRLHNEAVSHAEPLVRRLETEVRVGVFAGAREPPVQVSEAWESEEPGIRPHDLLRGRTRNANRYRCRQRSIRAGGLYIGGAVPTMVTFDCEVSFGPGGCCLPWRQRRGTARFQLCGVLSIQA